MSNAKGSKPQRIDNDFLKDLDEVLDIRIKRGLANPRHKEDISYREATNLLRRTNGYRISLEELKSKPKKK